jgi:hypothetical protein
MGPPRSSKKRPQANRAHGCVKEILALHRDLNGVRAKCRVRRPQRIRSENREGKSSEDSGHYSMRASADNVACLFGFSSRDQAHDYRDDK